MIHLGRRQQPSAVSQPQTKKQRIYAFLSTQEIGVLSTVDRFEQPRGSVVYYLADETLDVYFLTRAGTQKYHNIIGNPRVMLTVFDAVTQAVAQITGTAAEVQDTETLNHLAALTLHRSLKTSGTALTPIEKLQEGTYSLLRIHPTHISLAVYAQPGPGDYSQLFDVAESYELGQR